MNAIAAFLLAIVVTLISVLWQGFVFMKLWNWFIPTLFGLGYLALADAIGLALVITMPLVKYTMYENHEVDTSMTYLRVAIEPAMFLLIGYITHLYL